jgi:hypothetical protein
LKAGAEAALSDPLDVGAPTALVYETTEEARLILASADSELSEVRIAASEAAYYLSDAIEPDDRASLLALAERRRQPDRPNEDDELRAAEALALLGDVAGEVEEMLRGPSARSELRIALRALRGAIDALAINLNRSVCRPARRRSRSRGRI